MKTKRQRKPKNKIKSYKNPKIKNTKKKGKGNSPLLYPTLTHPSIKNFFNDKLGSDITGEISNKLKKLVTEDIHEITSNINTNKNKNKKLINKILNNFLVKNNNNLEKYQYYRELLNKFNYGFKNNNTTLMKEVNNDYKEIASNKDSKQLDKFNEIYDKIYTNIPQYNRL